MKEATSSSLWPYYLCTLIYFSQDRFQWSISEVTEKYALPCTEYIEHEREICSLCSTLRSIQGNTAPNYH